MNRRNWSLSIAALAFTGLLGACSTTSSPSAGIDNSALEQSAFRAHHTTYGLVYRLPGDAAGVLDTRVTPVLQADLNRLGLISEVNTFNLPHVTVVHIHSSDPETPRRMLAALPALPPVLKDIRLQKFYTTEAAKGAGHPWWLDLGMVKSGPAYTAMMDFNTRATAAFAPLRDGPLPRVTGPVYARMSEAGRALVQSVGVSGVNVVRDGKELRAYNPHNTLVYSMTPFTPTLQGAMQQVAEDLNKALPDGLTTTFRSVSIVELSFAGNVQREIYRISLEDGSAYEVATGKKVR